MTDANPPPPPKRNPNALPPEELVALLTRAGTAGLQLHWLQKDLRDGAPGNPDGTVNLVFYIAWLLQQMHHDD